MHTQPVEPHFLFVIPYQSLLYQSTSGKFDGSCLFHGIVIAFIVIHIHALNHRNALNNADDAAITKTIIRLGHSLNLKVIAEGVETKGELTISIK